MGLITSLLKGTVKTGYRGAKTFYKGGPLTRAAMGGAVGGIYGLVTSEMTGENTLGDMATMGFIGAVLGGSSALIRPALRSFSTTRYIKGGYNPDGTIKYIKHKVNPIQRQVAVKTLDTGFTVAKKAADIAFRHPYLVAGVAGAGLIGPSLVSNTIGGQTGASPSLGGAQMRTDYNQQALALEQMSMGSIAPMGALGTDQQYMATQQRQRMNEMEQSTQGLVQGLSRSRHG